MSEQHRAFDEIYYLLVAHDMSPTDAQITVIDYFMGQAAIMAQEEPSEGEMEAIQLVEELLEN